MTGKITLVVALVAALATGCKSKNESEPSAGSGEPAKEPAAEPAKEPAAEPAKPAEPAAAPAAPAGDAAGGGSCVAADGSCWEIQEPYDVKSTCAMMNGTHAAKPCDTAGYKTKCVQETQEDGKTFHWVYFRKAEDQTACSGTKTDL